MRPFRAGGSGGKALHERKSILIADCLIVPTSRRRTVRVGMPQWTLCVRFGTRSVPGCIPTQSVGTIIGGAITCRVSRGSSPGS
ncbi:hypothetical protein AWU82_28685 [Pseudomonas glycinae]|uniref:Uncharacterized protein n=1 Tax=Pseudomonas glycinae TaxID=1785145 RepID=A0ABN5FMY3_9PSED|nr:hypothetical protein AWU82_28685 [Pseudomonas glycinae]